VERVVEPVNTTRIVRASIPAKGVLLDPEEYLQALDLRNLVSGLFICTFVLFIEKKNLHKVGLMGRWFVGLPKTFLGIFIYVNRGT